jgi:hypothetical protein
LEDGIFGYKKNTPPPWASGWEKNKTVLKLRSQDTSDCKVIKARELSFLEIDQVRIKGGYYLLHILLESRVVEPPNIP